jgi:hypothetical protein
MKEKKYTYPRVSIERTIIEDDGKAPLLQLVFTSVVINRFDEEEVVQLISFYLYTGERDGECEMDSADKFHHMCREAYFSDPEEDDDNEDIEQEKPIKDSDITFNEEDERW